ncbi:hypothetical protein B0H63DRAFT_503377 [Podospora didyma]|uniref:Zn(2)-C6 fungal-type domain-containing protein n=1 Tax=Podospora didyma TaxID=330526 RepID=A0AAE0K9M8_9PEZI|nr:hypothetical protein B0H63DRAFT_503377 [Podospora didyma]
MDFNEGCGKQQAFMPGAFPTAFPAPIPPPPPPPPPAAAAAAATTTGPASTPSSRPRPPVRITAACEACRGAKVKCQGANQMGICKRCIESKRECIFTTGPRKRRPRNSRQDNADVAASGSSRPPNPNKIPYKKKPTRTFTIDVPMLVVGDVADSLETLRVSHEDFIGTLVPDLSSGEDYDYDYDDDDDDDGDENNPNNTMQDGGDPSRTGSVVSSHVSSHTTSSLPAGASALSTPPPRTDFAIIKSRGRNQRTVASFGLQPQFNLESAAGLLATFRDMMLEHFPCVVIGPDVTVASLARRRPFLLLSVLAAASSSRTLQGHSLYDEEFRKILGLKFVASGERTIELLEGLAVYIAWYPFHLRPKNKQAFQYIRMAVDIVNDLELDQDKGTDDLSVTPTPERLDKVRIYLAIYYIGSSYASSWNRTPSLQYTSYTAKCCDVLEASGQTKLDSILAWQVRFQRIMEETNGLRRNPRWQPQSESQIGIMLKGMESQLDEWETKMSPEVAAAPSIRMSVCFTRIFLSGAPLLKLPSSKSSPSLDTSSSFRADPRRLFSVIPALHAAYDYYLTLSAREINAFSGGLWGSLILTIILGFRMSFPLAVCPEWDDRAARQQLRFGEYIEKLSRLGMGGDGDGDGGGTSSGAKPHNKTTDILSASRVVLGVVLQKYLKRVAKLEHIPRPGPSGGKAIRPPRLMTAKQHKLFAAAHPELADMSAAQAAAQVDTSMAGCPMMDGSLESYFPYWEETFTAQLAAASTTTTAQSSGSTAEAHTAIPQEQGGGGGGGGEKDPAAGGGGVAVDTTIGNEHHLTMPDYNDYDLWTAVSMDWPQEGGGDITFEEL